MTLAPLDIPALLKRYNLHPEKKLGQNFLVDTQALQRVVESSELTEEDVVLEVGPGLGSLTRLLAGKVRRVVAVELDARLIPVLQEILAPFSNISLVQGDILEMNPFSLMIEKASGRMLADDSHLEQASLKEQQLHPYLVVANIPYNITSALLRHLLDTSKISTRGNDQPPAIRPTRLVLTVQQEVAERIVAQPGKQGPSTAMSLLALSVQVYGAPRIMGRIPASAFYPPPQVDSAIVRVDIYAQPLFPKDVLDEFFRLAKAGFSQKRKTLRNSLSAGLGLPPMETSAFLNDAGIDPQRRAETLSLEEWRLLAEIRLATRSA